MFMPVEASWVALTNTLVQEEALGQNVLLVSTSTLIATCAPSATSGSRKSKRRISRNAERGSKLYHQIYAFLDEFSKIRTSSPGHKALRRSPR